LRCKCGNQFETRNAHVISGKVKSCGCVRRRQQRRFSNYCSRRQYAIDMAAARNEPPTLPPAVTTPPKSDALLDDFAARLKALRTKRT
jgi:hypothetical protein